MVKIKAFKGVRPPRALAAKVSARPYDVLSSEEARAEAEGLPMSLYHINKPEINFPVGTSEYDERLYAEATRQYALFKQNGWLKQDPTDCYYVYAQTWRGKTQFGLMVAAAVEDYEAGRIKRHELTRQDKEDDRMRHVIATNANIGPAFFAYPANAALHAILMDVVKGEPEYDFVADDVRHQLWIISDEKLCQHITDIFADIPCLYIADGHHRSAAAARVGAERRKMNPQHNGSEEYNYFLATCFSADELTVLDYNRLVLDLNGHSPADVLQLLAEDFTIDPAGSEVYHPAARHEFALYIDGCWYRLTAKAERVNDSDPIAGLDVSVSSELILKKLFGIVDLRKDERVEFVGGIRGLDYLQDQVDNGHAQLALALFPVSLDEIMRVADAGQIMPPKATWFEPKLRSGIVVHELD